MRGPSSTAVDVLETAEIFSSSARSRPDASWSDEELFGALKDAGPSGRELIQDLLVRRHAGLVRWLAAQYTNPVVSGDELRQVGYLGLILAIRRFEPERGSDFKSFARPTIQGEIRRHFRDKRRWIRLPRGLQEAKAALQKATEETTHRMGRHPTIDELAAHSQLSVELVREALGADDTFTAASLDAHLSREGEESFTVADLLGDPDTRLELFIVCESLRSLVLGLSERERHLLYLRFYEEKTQSQIGDELGISQMQVSRLLVRVLGTLRQALTSD